MTSRMPTCGLWNWHVAGPGLSISFKEATPVDQDCAEGPIIDSPIINLTFTRTPVYFASNQRVGLSQILSSCFPLVTGNVNGAPGPSQGDVHLVRTGSRTTPGTSRPSVVCSFRQEEAKIDTA
jgi:hypothetical protein